MTLVVCCMPLWVVCVTARIPNCVWLATSFIADWIVLAIFFMLELKLDDNPFSDDLDALSIFDISDSIDEDIPLKLFSTADCMFDALLVISDSIPLKSLAPPDDKLLISANDELDMSLMSPVTLALKLSMSIDPLDSKSANILETSVFIPDTESTDPEYMSSILPNALTDRPSTLDEPAAFNPSSSDAPDMCKSISWLVPN